MTTYQYTTLANSNQNGPLVDSLTVGQAAQLAYLYVANYPAFVAQAAGLVNQDVQALEMNEPEGQRNVLAISGWGGLATQAASAVNQAWQQGQIAVNGQQLQAWPEAPFAGQIAWADSTGQTLVLRWVKWEWQLYLLVAILLAVVGYEVYQILTSGSWQLQTAIPVTTHQTPTSGTGPFGGVPFIGGSPFRVFWMPWYDAVAVAGVAVTGPFVYRQIAQVDESRARIHRAEHQLTEEA